MSVAEDRDCPLMANWAQRTLDANVGVDTSSWHWQSCLILQMKLDDGVIFFISHFLEDITEVMPLPWFIFPHAEEIRVRTEPKYCWPNTLCPANMQCWMWAGLHVVKPGAAAVRDFFRTLPGSSKVRFKGKVSTLASASYFWAHRGTLEVKA